MPGSKGLAVSLPKLPKASSSKLQNAGSRQRLLTQSVDIFRNLLLALFILRITRSTFLHLRGYGLVGSAQKLYRDTYRQLYALFLRLPLVRARVQADVDKAITELQQKLVPSGPGVTNYTSLPASGWTVEQVNKELDKLAEMTHTRWEEGRVSGAVYHGGRELCDLQKEAFGRFGVANPIHPDVFPGVRKMEAEVVAMVLGLFHAPRDTGAGVSTSGGTESIVMAVLAARQKAYAERGVRKPEMVLPETAHTAFRKAGDYFGIKVHIVPCPAPSYKVDTKRVSRHINSNTILLVGSAPNFPHGIVDDIPALSRLALKHRLPLHVDCCLGSFIIPMLEKAGFPAPDFDFRVPGVTSISVDTHKYGFAPKGNSVVLYRTAELRRYQYYVCPDWSGGVYASPGLAGSRPGALIAGAWASLMRMGEDGYLDSCLKIVGARQTIETAIRENASLRSSLKVIGKPMVSVVAFFANPTASASDRVDIYDVADGMSSKGWHLNALQDPPAIHVAVTLPTVLAVEALIRDLEVVVGECRGKAKEGKMGDAAALYGVAGALPDKSVVRELAGGFLDTLYLT
ncbi:sphingosine-1-phosphate lyase-like protein [Teratosphaeria nubilosa]|uniref:sphinganine-1-phosphate aldolase n=1 Tax=Teratosphaeria nubilosa TaxID=161662 RepID=A0A6G1L728_9PEZI|nr:sphingosine-1-phosphate lyase-like protein [Teratosphaeria nubilosa]